MSSSGSSGNATLKSFPADRCDALAMLYMESQDLSGKSPEELAEMYYGAYSKISEKFKALREQEHTERRKSGGYRPLY